MPWNRLTFLMMVLYVSGNCPAQIQKQLEEDRKTRVQEYFLDLISLRAELPNRWAAFQVRETVDTAKLDLLEIHEGLFEELMVCDTSAKICYTRISQRSRKKDPKSDEEGLPMGICAYSSPQKKLFRIEDEPWKAVGTIPNIGYPRTDPLNWCFGLMITARNGRLADENYLSNGFFSDGSECIEARETRNGKLIGLWIRHPGPGKEKHISASFVKTTVFDTKSKLIEEYSGSYANEGMDIKEAVRKNELKTVEIGKIAWEKFQFREKDKTKEIMLPVHVHIISTMIEGEEIECHNRIRWLFGSEIPDNSFKLPTDKSFREPDVSAFLPKPKQK